MKNLLFRVVAAAFLVLVFAVVVGAQQLMLPQVYHGDENITGWWMSEKLDGVRGYWSGTEFFSKRGLKLHPPAEFIAQLPPFALDGELWAGRQGFEKTVSVVTRKQAHSGWLQLKFAIFDVPQGGGPFSERIVRAQRWFAEHPSAYAFVIKQIPVRDREHLTCELERVESLGGEGLVVRNPQAEYLAGRSSAVLKVKNYRDAEAVVIDHLPGKGRNDGRMGALLVELSDGTEFKIGSGFSDAMRESPPELGTVVTFKYYGMYESGIPKFPSFLRVRYDSDL